MIKKFEQFNADDPYGEENWEEKSSTRKDKLVDDLFNALYKDDDPKNDSSNIEHLKSLSIEAFLSKINEKSNKWKIMPDNITKDFEEYKEKKAKEFKKKKTFEPLSSDIVALRELEDGNIEKVKGPIEILQVTGVITDKDRIEKLEEAISGGPQFNADLGSKEVKRGDVIWVTALAIKPGTASWNAQPSYHVLKCRIVDIFYGLNKLKTIK